MPQLPFPDDDAIHSFFREDTDLVNRKAGLKALLEGGMLPLSVHSLSKFTLAIINRLFASDYMANHTAGPSEYILRTYHRLSRHTDMTFFQPG